MKKNILLFKDMVLAEGLSYKEACGLLKKAVESPASSLIRFSILMEADGPATWSLTGSVNEVCKAFLVNPDDFVITMEQE